MKLIQNFLIRASPDFGGQLYKEGMEAVILVHQADGEAIGKAFTNGVETWHTVRTPCREPKFDLNKYAECVGLSGWNWKEKKSYWVGFDFDSLVGHKSGLSDSDLKEIIEKAKDIPYVTIRRSTSGLGLHIYIFFTTPVPSSSRKDHILLANAVLSNLSVLLSFNFKSQVDTCGSILWVWSRKQKPNSFEVVKDATTTLSEIPHISSAEFKGKIRPLTTNLRFTKLNEQQQELVRWFGQQRCTWWWESDLNMLVCHTFDLGRAHSELKLKGLFYTNSTGANCPNDQNCFMFPIKNGGWIVRRHHQGTKEHEFWRTDKSGWTYCYFNRLPSLDDLAALYGGQINAKGEYIFLGRQNLYNVFRQLAPNSDLSVPDFAAARQYRVKPIKDSRVVIYVEREPNDPPMQGWINGKKTFEKVIAILTEEVEVNIPDTTVRHVVAENKDAGWYLYSRNVWIDEPKDNIKSALLTMGHSSIQSAELIGQCVLNPWVLVNRPFEVEYPGNREWNKFSVQLMVDPKEGKFDKWQRVLDHLGRNLNVTENSWCQANGVTSGSAYLKMWLASLFQFPLEPLPYLFLYGPQGSGKSTLHEITSLLLSRGGVVKADTALTSAQRHNSELAGAILCTVEEINLRKVKGAYDRIKDWATAKTISIHAKYGVPFDMVNSTHWIQCANQSDYCPIQLGDTRILIIYVDLPENPWPKEQLLAECKEQAAGFLYELLNIVIPPAVDRLRIPVIETQEKAEEQLAAANLVEQFIISECKSVKGHLILYKDFCVAFHNWLEKNGGRSFEWSSTKIGRSIPHAPGMPVKGRYGGEGQLWLGNISFNLNANDKQFYYSKNADRLIEKE